MNLEWSKNLIGFNSILFLGELFTLVQEILWKISILSLAKEEEQKNIKVSVFSQALEFPNTQSMGKSLPFYSKQHAKKYSVQLIEN
jgi:hypothetical protein